MIFPTSVSIPVETTTPRPLPYVTIPLEKAILIRSPRAGSVAVRGSVVLSTGTDSPVGRFLYFQVDSFRKPDIGRDHCPCFKNDYVARYDILVG